MIGVSKNDTLLSKFIKGGYSEKDYLNNITITMAMAAMLSVMTTVTAFAEVDIPLVED